MYKKLLAVCLASLFTVVIAHGQLVNYQIDDGTVENGVGITGANPFDIIWLNTFATQPGGAVITNISAAFGSPADVRPYNGLPITVLLYTDANGGSPLDAVLLQQVSGVISLANTGMLANFVIPPTLVGPNFVIGILARNLPGGAGFVASLDQTDPDLANRSFAGFAISPATIDPANLGALGANFGTIEGFGLPGNWVLRATAIPEPSTWGLLAVGGLTGIWLRRRARKA